MLEEAPDDDSVKAAAAATTTTTHSQESSKNQETKREEEKKLCGGAQGPCCFYITYGKCEPPRGHCRFRHDFDDGITPCCFGATCRLGHAGRALPKDADPAARLEYWKKYNADRLIGFAPALRDATLLRSQLEPWPTAVLRDRLATVFGESYTELDGISRGDIMRRLLAHYDAGHHPRRTTIRVQGSTRIREDLERQLLEELLQWRKRHTTNTRPSIDAKCYMILRSPMEFQTKTSNHAKNAAKKLKRNQALWELARMAVHEVDPEFGANFSALAITYGFTGSPHIDKQNTSAFYGLALGDFPEGQGGVCVEVDAFQVAHVNTKSRLGKIDGRFPHWVAPYDSSGERYSLIYYSTWQTYEQPTKAYFGAVLEEE